MYLCRVIRIDNLSIGYRQRRHSVPVASGLCAEAADGLLICLTGVNGVGKSTLLKTVCGFMPPLSGEVLIGSDDGVRRVSEMSRQELSQRIGVVLTGRTELTHLTVLDVVGMGRTPYTGLFGNLSDADNKAVEQAIAMTGIAQLSERYADTLSDGERQKVMIAKALAQQTPVIILDEPSAFLDYPSKEELMRLLQRLAHDEGKTILLSSHDLDIVSRTADGFWIMEKENGKVLIRQEKTLAVFP